MDSKKNHKFKYILPIVVLVLVLIAGVSYAWFTYREEGETSKVIAGSLYLTMNEGNDTINIENIFPETKEEARASDNNFITFTLKGKNTSTQKDINYEIKLTNGTDKSGKERFNPEDLVFDLIEIGDNDEETIILDAVSYDELNEKRIWVDKVEKNTTTEFVKTYKLRMWIDEDVVISDTDPNADYKATGVDAYKNHYASVKVAVEGDLEEKELPLTVVSNSTMVQNGQAYITNTIENVNSENNSDTFELTITSSNDNVRFSYDTTGVNVTNISTEDNIYKVSPLINDETDYEIRGIDNEVELTDTFTKTYTILNNQKVEFNIGLVSVNGMETDTDLSFTLKKNNVVIQELVKHVKVKGLSYSVALNIGDSVTYSGDTPNIVADNITMPDGRPYSGNVTYTYYGNSSCTGTSLSSAPTNAGTYCVKVTIPLENNETTEVTKTFTIDKATVPVTISSDGGDYTGSAMPMDVSPTGAVVKYYTDSACTTGETTTAPVNVGTYYAKASLSNDQNYNDAESSCISYSIEAKEIDSSDIEVDSSSIVYDGTAKTPTITITDGTNTLLSGTDYSVVYTDNTNAGEATITITMNGNYTGEIVKHFTINKATDVVTLTAKSDVYTGSAIIANTATSVSGTTITYTYYGTSDCTGNALSGAPTDAGNYSVKAESAGNSNYNSGNTCVTHTINKAACTLTTTAQTMYTGDTLTLNTAANNAKGTLSYALKSGGNNTTTPSTISTGVLTAGAMSTANDTDETVDIEITDTGNNNYNGCTKDLVVTVQKYTRTLSWANTTPAENDYVFGSTSTATATVTGTGGTASTVTYSSSNTSYATVNASTGVITVVDPTNKSVTITASLPRTSTVKEATSITRTVVTGEVWAENLSYSNTNSPGIDCTGDNATAQCAVDYIANLLGFEPQPICKRATVLHTEQCTNESTTEYCYADGYYTGGSMNTTTITYGNLGTSGSAPAVGDAFDCDVNGDGTYDSATERFYYISNYYDSSLQTFDNNTAVLLYYTNTSDSSPYSTTADVLAYGYSCTGATDCNLYGPVTAIQALPSKNVWKNVKLKETSRTILACSNSNCINNSISLTTPNGTIVNPFAYAGKAARLLTIQELYSTNCATLSGKTSLGTNGSLGACNFLIEDTAYADSSKPTYGPWFENARSDEGYPHHVWAISYNSRKVLSGNPTGNRSVRPVIDVPLDRIEY